MASTTRQLDTQIDVVTPENIAFRYRVAGPFHRLPAYLIDFAIRAVVMTLSASLYFSVFSFADLTQLAIALTLVTWFVLSWFYGGLFETFWNGQTPGKRWMGLRVLSVDGRPITALQAVLRNILREVDSLPAVTLPGWFVPLPIYLIGLVSSLMNDRYQRLGDLACGTMVVVEEPAARVGMARINEPEVIRLASYIPPSFRVSRSLARALSDYVDRRRNLGPQRRTEIARHLATPLREQLGLHPETDPDVLLCALYHRAFITDNPEAALVHPRAEKRSAQPV